jgi:hypothetical protein
MPRGSLVSVALQLARGQEPLIGSDRSTETGNRQAERYQRGEIGQRPGYTDNPFRPR